MLSNEDVTEEVNMENGHPIFESLCCNTMRNIGEDYLRARGLIE